MDSDDGKLFIGGISVDTEERDLKDHFSHYGHVTRTMIMRDKMTGRSRGFGFVIFQDPSILDGVLVDKHVICGRTVEAKHALSREEQQNNPRSMNSIPVRSAGSDAPAIRTKKIFVGGLPPSLTEEGFQQYFEAYGNVTDVVIMFDQNTQRPRGFGFITFDTEDAVERVLHRTFHDLNGKQVEVKRALPKDGGGRAMGGGGSGGGGNVGFGNYGYNSSGGGGGGNAGRMDPDRYPQPQSYGGGGGGYPPSESSGYGGPPSYGYGPGSGMGYGGYSGYGNSSSGYTGGSGSVGYGNFNASSAGYSDTGNGAPRGPWGGQGGYDASGFGNSGWGASGTGNMASGSMHAGQSTAGYGGQGYGYGQQGGGGSYANPYDTTGGRSGGGPAGGDRQTSYMDGGGYMGSNPNTGYGNTPSRSDSSQPTGPYGAHAGSISFSGQTGLSGGYGGPHAR